MTNEELKEALLSKAPIIHTHGTGETEYSYVDAIIYRARNGTIKVSVKLMDRCKNSVVVANAEEVRFK